ncbi:MAG: PD-(D/E)XK nuclease family protein [Paludibacteraceae bacterium]|nr:PD-(D/E)XK nuclease family protein [Paludibacteraceae bacterium]
MEPFLKQIATLFFQQQGVDISNTLFVFPSKRACVFFQQYLSQFAQVPFFAPACYTIGDFFTKLSPQYESANKLELLFDMYRCYINCTQSTESFDSFMGFGEILLKDFNDIDNYLVDANLLYSNIANLNDLSDLSYLSKEQIEALTRYLGFFEKKGSAKQEKAGKDWHVLSQLYKQFTETILAKGLTYDGLRHRLVCQMPQWNLPVCKQVVFIGFNALDGATKHVFNRLKDMGIADFYWDYQSDYIQDKNNKAHYFIQENLSNFPSKYTIQYAPLSTPTIHTISIASQIGQCKYVNQLLAAQNNVNETAIVLANEQLLIPMLYALPKDIPVNITMGYALNQTSLCKLIEDYILLQTTCNEDGFYHTHVWNILQHAYIKETFHIEVDTPAFKALKRYLQIAPATLQEALQEHPALQHIFSKADTNMLDTILQLINNLTITNKKEKELLTHTRTALNRLFYLINQNSDIKLQPKTLIQVIKQALSSINVSFIGQPTQGLQLMGVLETRCLDFKQVIITSFNEGIYPQKDTANSYIPYTIRNSFGLPTTEHQDAIYAYNFYRLIQRASNVYLLYDTRTDGAGNSSEISRFVKQLKFVYNHPVEHISVNCSAQIQQNLAEKIVRNTDNVANKVQHYLTKVGLSPSALNTFIKCPLQFYFSSIEKIFIEESVGLDLQANQFGKIYHYVMEYLYKPFTKVEVSKQNINDLLADTQQIDNLIERGFVHEIHQVEKDEDIAQYLPYTLKGMHKLNAEVIKAYVIASLKQDLYRAPFVYIAGENYVYLQFKQENLPITVKLKGTIDRIESNQNGIHLYDYKTSKTTQKTTPLINTDMLRQLFDANATHISNRSEQLQICFYQYIAKFNYPNNPIHCHLYYVRTAFEDPELFNASTQRVLPENWEEAFTEELNTCIQNMLNPEIVTSPTLQVKHCEFCKYRDICAR